MSVAKTEQYYLFSLRPGLQIELFKMSDLYAWEDMRTENELEQHQEQCGTMSIVPIFDPAGI